jgi:primosomal protein DnaI
MEKVNFDKVIVKDLSEARKEAWNKIINNQNIKDFINKNSIPDDVVSESLGYFITYLENEESCSKCQSYSSCNQLNNGFVVELTYDSEKKKINLEYRVCDNYARILKLRSGFIYYEYDEALFDKKNISLNSSKYRVPIIERMGNLLLNKTTKGLYIYGKSGVGKSYLLAVMAHQLVESGKKCAFISTSSLTERLRTFLLDEPASFMEEMNRFKNVDVLILDDIGGEKATAWIRDEVLFSLLDYRMKNKNLITCFSSNYSLKDYKTVMTLQDEKKADRLISRISVLADEFELIDLNHRI